MKQLPEDLRPDLEEIAGLIEKGSRVLDLGCGNGELLDYLAKKRDVTGTGIEISEEPVLECVSRGIPVYRGDIEDGLSMFTENSFDWVVLSQTLQQIVNPGKVLERLLLTGKKAIVSFPNFGYLMTRLDLLTLGRMPKNRLIPYEWHTTPNIHHLTVSDFRNFCKNENIKIIRERFLGSALAGIWPNLFGKIAIFVIGRK